MQYDFRRTTSSITHPVKIRGQEVRKQVARLWPTTTLALAAVIVGLAGVYILSILTQTPFSALTRDPAVVTKSPVYIGVLSNIGVLFWSAAAGICMLSAATLWSTAHQRQRARFLGSFGALSLLMTLDDAFMLHDLIFPTYLHIPQKLIYLGYAIAIVGSLLYFLRTILTTDYLLLAVGLLFMGMSISIDVAMHVSNLETSVEDSFKFAGIVFWLIYFFRTGVAMMRQATAET